MRAPSRFVLATALSVTVWVLPCAARARAEQPTQLQAARTPETPVPPELHEAPGLGNRAQAGEIPAVARRIPGDPLVLTAPDRSGPYGGTLRIGLVRDFPWALWTDFIGSHEIRPGEDGQPAAWLLKSYEISPDGRVITFHLRQGLKWSDGDPCDADDYLFAWRDVIQNPALTPRKPVEAMAGGRLGRVDKVDQRTVRYTFQVPNLAFVRRLAQARSFVTLVRPSHYLRRFHAAYTKAEELDAAVAAGSYQDWTHLFADKANPWTNPDLPVLDPWVRSGPVTEGVLTLVRNPYFWQVDTEGNQLPYLDGLEVTVHPDRASLVRAALGGESELTIVATSDLPPEDGGDATADGGAMARRAVEPMHANIHTVFLNRGTVNAPLATMFGDVRFRRALSLAVDRAAIAQAVHRDRATPSQVAPLPGTPAYDETSALANTVQDLEGANAELDSMGLAWDAQHQSRVADGAPVKLDLIYPVTWPPGQTQAVAAMAADWARIGIEVTPKGMERSSWLEAIGQSDWQMTVYAVNAGGGPYLPLSSDGVFPLDGYWLPSPAWGTWIMTGGETGSEPPSAVKKLNALYEEYVTTATPVRAVEIEREAFALYSHELLGIGVLNRAADELVAFVARDLINLPSGALPDDLGLIRPALLAWAAGQ